MVILTAAATLTTACIALLLVCARSFFTAPDKAVHPVVDAQRGYLLGGSQGGKWITAQRTASLLRAGETTYRVYSLARYVGQGRGDRPRAEGEPCPETLFVSIKPSRSGGEIAIGGGAWNALRRVPRPLSVKQTVYRNAVAAVLKSKGIRNPEVRITRILRVDLEGDGVDEVLISAARHRRTGAGSMTPNAEAGDYSVVLMRKVVRGKVQTILLSAEFYPRPATFAAPTRFDIAAVLDANGDGRMEVAVRGQYYEGGGTRIFEVQGKTVKAVLDAGCGA